MFPNRWSLMWKSNEIEFLSRNPTTNALKKVKVNKWHVENFPICFKVRKHGQQKTCNLSCCAFCHPHQTCLGTNQVANRLKTWMVKRATSLFNSFSCNVAKQVVRFLLPVLPKLYLSSAVIDRKKPTRATLSGNQSEVKQNQSGPASCFHWVHKISPLTRPYHVRHIHTMPLGSCVSTKTIPDRDCVHTQEWWFRRDFYNGAKLHRADLKNGASHIG